MNTIKIFLASSAELERDREEFEIFIARENNIYVPKGTRLELKIWEDFIDAMSVTRLQDEYNKAIRDCDIFVMLFFTKVGKFTEEEFEKAFQQFLVTKKPLVYTYFKNEKREFKYQDNDDARSLWAFRKKLKVLGHFETIYDNKEALHLHFKQQLDKLFAAGYFKFPDPGPEIPKCLSAGQPPVPPSFIGRDIELSDIGKKLDACGLLLLNGEGGMGKTTLAAKWLSENSERYKHYSWLFCGKGIIEQIKTFAAQLKVDLRKYPNEEEQLLAIKTAMQNLPKECLLILDNVNEPKYIEVFQNNFGGLQWHVLITSRCQQVLPGENEYTLDHLRPGQARELFKSYHDEKNAGFESLLDKFLVLIGYNTLLIELFSKNLHELSAIGETLTSAMEQFEEKGLFRGDKSFDVTTSYTGNVHKNAVTTDQIIELLYDFTKLNENERYLLVNLAMLPAENHLLTLLIEVLTPEDKINFARQLKTLARKGWLNTDIISYRMSPVVQQIILAKNSNGIKEDSAILVANLGELLSNDRGSLINLGSYSQAQPFAKLANSVAGFLHNDGFEKAYLLLNLSDYYTAVGNLKVSTKQLNKATEIFKKVDKENYAVCLGRLGFIYHQKGDIKKALRFYEQFNELCKKLLEANPDSGSLKKRFAISYERLGSIYKQQGDFEKALPLFELESALFKELVEADPADESLKDGLAISYSDQGSVYLEKGDFKSAQQFFQLDLNLTKELFEAYPHREPIKNGLAISYFKLGSVYQKLSEFNKAQPLFERSAQLTKELFEANPMRESLKSELSISYEKLGDIFQLQGDFVNALKAFELRSQLAKELLDVNPQSMVHFNGLAVSYAKLGSLYIELHQPAKAKYYFQMAEATWISLTGSVPEVVEFQNNLIWVKQQLESM